WNSRAHSLSTFAAAAVTSGPIPSPGSSTMDFFMIFLMQQFLCPALCRGRRLGGNRRCAAADHLVSNPKNIARPHGFRFVSQGGYPAINFREFRVSRFKAQVAKAHAQRVPAGVLAHHKGARRHTNRFWRNDFIRRWILDDAVLMNSGFVSKCVRAHDGFIRSDLRTGNFREHAAGWKQMLQFDVGGYAE